MEWVWNSHAFSREEFLKLTLLDIRPAEEIHELLRQTDLLRPMGQSTAEKWRHGTKDGRIIPMIITSWG